jgi:hypothetical protein
MRSSPLHSLPMVNWFHVLLFPFLTNLK